MHGSHFSNEIPTTDKTLIPLNDNMELPNLMRKTMKEHGL